MVPQAAAVGVDGARDGWLAVWRDQAGVAFSRYADAQQLICEHRAADVIAVDVPIGLTENGPRESDVLARRFVGGRRACSIFSAPVRGVIDCSTQPLASQRHREIDGRGFGAQAFAILPKIREWDDLLHRDEGARLRVREVHPEVSFAALNGGIGLALSKKRSGGLAARKMLLADSFAGEVDRLLRNVPRGMAAADDVLDALVALWTAERILAGTARSLPDPIHFDALGLPIAIYY